MREKREKREERLMRDDNMIAERVISCSCLTPTPPHHPAMEQRRAPEALAALAALRNLSPSNKHLRPQTLGECTFGVLQLLLAYGRDGDDAEQEQERGDGIAALVPGAAQLLCAAHVDVAALPQDNYAQLTVVLLASLSAARRKNGMCRVEGC